MTWKKYFKPTASVTGPSISVPDKKYTSVQKYSSWLPEIYDGPSDRLTRYQIYETMDYDHEVHAALDTISDFSTENDGKTKRPFTLEFDGNPSPNEVTIVSKMLKQWCTLNEMDKRLWGMFRGTLMYGDQFFIRDPETFKLFWCDPKKVTKAIVNESKGKKIECFYVKDLDLNVQDMIATSQQQGDQGRYAGASIMFSAPFNGVIGFGNATSGNAVTDGRFGEEGEVPINADHMLQLTLSDGMTSSWPFGTSVLEYVYKVYKQKELLEDSVIIYRIHRAPERRVFFIDVGQMPPNKAQQYLERVRYEVQQKRIPSKSGGGSSLTDSGYNPMSQLEDYFFSVTCITLDTKIPLLNGKEKTLSELIEDYDNGIVNYAYTVNQTTFEMEPGKIVWAGVTRKDAELVEVELDNGEKIRLTPDHRFIMRDGSEVEAQDLKEGDSLMPLYLIDSKTSSKQKGKPYLRYVCNSDGKTKWVHTTVCPKKNPGKEYEIHHIDFDSKNNSPENLIEMEAGEHRALHRKVGTYSIGKQWKSKKGREKLLNGIRKYHDEMSPEDKEKIIERNRKNGIKARQTILSNPELVEEISRKISDFHSSQDYKMIYSNQLADLMLELVEENIGNIRKIDDVRLTLEKSSNFMSLWYDLNKEKHLHREPYKSSINNFVIERIRELYKLTKYQTWDNHSKYIGIKFERHNFSEKNITEYNERLSEYDANPSICEGCEKSLPYKKRNNKYCDNKCYQNHRKFLHEQQCNEKYFNHKVKSVRFLTAREDTGDITIESKSGSHNFAVSAGVYIHNSEGRGSSVQTLPGGENLGCFSLDTLIKLHDGRDLSISEIEQEMKKGKQLWTYSCHPITGETSIGKIDWAGTTRKNAKVQKLVLSNGKEVICTPDHKFPVLNKGFVEAKDFKVGDSITAFNFNDSTVFVANSDFGYTYTVNESGGKIEVTRSIKLKDKAYKPEISIIDIIHLDERMDVGTLTIDQDELIHDYHTYALSAGIFAKNSIDDLRYFNNKMLRALGVPSSYLPTGPEDGTASYNDGRLGTAFIQEFRFSKVCERYQKQISKAFDREFKLYLKHRGVNIDNSTFELKLPEPQSFSEYRQLELDAAKINVFQSMADVPYISKRFALKRYLNLSEEEMTMNEKMWKEEQGAAAKQQSSAKNDLSSAGITSSGIDSMAPMGGFDEEEFTDDMGDDFGGEEDFGDEGFDTDVDLGGEEPEV